MDTMQESLTKVKLQNQTVTIFSNTFISIFHHTQEKERYNSDHASQHIEYSLFPPFSTKKNKKVVMS